MKKMELVFIPSPAISHLVSNFEFAKRLLDRDDRFSVTILVIRNLKYGLAVHYAESLAASNIARLRFINLPQIEVAQTSLPKRHEAQEAVDFVESYKLYVKEFIVNNVLLDSVSFAGLFVDMFTVCMIDVANELGLPCYLFSPFGAACLGFTSYVITRFERVGREFQVSDPESLIPGYVNPVPNSMFGSLFFNHDGYLWYLKLARRFKETKAIIINSFAELESQAVKSLQEPDLQELDWPPICLVGPLIDHHGHSSSLCDEVKRSEIMKWLDDQPPATVVFLSFGSFIPMDETQNMEIAKGLEQCGFRFLWSVRMQRPASDVPGKPNEVLQGFLERTKGRGMVCSWAPQIEVLAHKSIGGFVSHCGWNSILESLWYGVPIVAWPMYAEQQLNAFLLVKDLGLAVEMRLDYKIGESELVMADDIEKAIKSLMEGDGEVRKRVKKISQSSKEAVKGVNGCNGSSFTSFSHSIELMIHNV